MALSPNINNREADKFRVLNTLTNTVVKVHPQDLQTNLFQAVKTNVGTSATKIEFPEEGNEFTIYHVTASTNVSIGPDDQVTAGGAGTAPMPPEFKINVVVKKGNDNGIYGIVSSGTVDVFVIGMLRE